MHYVNKATIERVNNLNILDYAQSMGYDIKRAGKTYHMPNFGGLFINNDKNEFYCFALKKGGGIIQFVMLTENKTWKESVDMLVEQYNISANKETSNEEINSKARKMQKDSLIDDEEIKKEIQLDEKDITQKNLIAYLTKTRKIDMEFVQRALDEKKIYQSVKKSIVYKTFNEKGELTGAAWETTSTLDKYKGQKGIFKNSTKNFPFEFKGTGEKVYVFESPVDLMSYLTLQKMQGKYDTIKNENFIALLGIADTPLENWLKNNPNIKQIYFCYDNDKDGTITMRDRKIPKNHGQDAAKEQCGKYNSRYSCIILTPTLKDYNDELKNYVANLEKEKMQDINKKNDIVTEKSDNEKEGTFTENERKDDIDFGNNEEDIETLDDGVKKELDELYMQQTKLQEKSKAIVEEIDSMKNNLKELKMTYETTITKLLDTKEKIFTMQKKQMEDIIKNNAYIMVKSGINLNIVHQATKVEMEELRDMQEEVIENGNTVAYGIEPKIFEKDRLYNNIDEEEYIPLLHQE